MHLEELDRRCRGKHSTLRWVFADNAFMRIATWEFSRTFSTFTYPGEFFYFATTRCKNVVYSRARTVFYVIGMYFRESVSKKKEKKKKSVTRNTWINNKYLEFIIFLKIVKIKDIDSGRIFKIRSNKIIILINIFICIIIFFL